MKLLVQSQPFGCGRVWHLSTAASGGFRKQENRIMRRIKCVNDYDDRVDEAEKLPADVATKVSLSATKA